MQQCLVYVGVTKMTDTASWITFGKDRYHLNEEMAKWCRDKFGLGGYIPPADGPWMMRTMFGNTTFAFKEQKHYNWFVLRWIHGK